MAAKINAREEWQQEQRRRPAEGRALSRVSPSYLAWEADTRASAARLAAGEALAAPEVQPVEEKKPPRFRDDMTA